MLRQCTLKEQDPREKAWRGFLMQWACWALVPEEEAREIQRGNQELKQGEQGPVVLVQEALVQGEQAQEEPVREVPVREVLELGEQAQEEPVREVPVREVPVREVPVREVLELGVLVALAQEVLGREVLVLEAQGREVLVLEAQVWASQLEEREARGSKHCIRELKLEE
jgi:hypothetical protein